MLITAIPFLLWDAIFTHWGVWGFSPRYTLGISFFGLPLEEFMFFFAIPYCCVFSYEVLNFFFGDGPTEAASRYLAKGLFYVVGTVGILFVRLHYTASTMLLAAVFLGLYLWVFKWSWFPKFLRAYGVILFPFLIVNGILTGTGLEEPIVWYNDVENLGVRILTIPLEDTIYGFLLIGLNVAIYEFLLSRSKS